MDINARLEKLERENRRMKKIGIVASVVLAMFIVGCHAKASKIVEANELRLVDVSGKVRVRLSASGLIFYASDGKIVADLSTAPSPILILGSTGAGPPASLGAGTATVPATLSLGSGSRNFFVAAGQSFSLSGSGGIVHVNTSEDLGPTLILTDNEGYSINLGRADLEAISTGRKTRTPAASLVLFGKDKKVLWSAP